MITVPTSLNIDWSGCVLHNPNTITTGINGKLVEDYLRNCGFSVDPHGVIDLPNLGTHGVEVKTRGVNAIAPHTVGTMLLSNILNSDWDATTFKQKLCIQLRVVIGVDDTKLDNVMNGIVVDSPIVDFRHAEIQAMFRSSYNKARDNLRIGLHGTAAGSRYGFLEHRSGNSYAFRITDLGMRNAIKTASFVKNNLFEYA